jgi:hypothetical protein
MMKKIILILAIIIIGILGYIKYNQLNTKDVVDEKLPDQTVIDENKTIIKETQIDQNKTITPENRGEVRDEMRLAGCPDKLIVNKMPGTTPKSSYYIKDGARVETSEYDSVWVSANCEVTTEVVY